MQIRIITDDFTSATDGLPAFAERGWRTAVALSSAYSSPAQVISTDTDSRTLPQAQASAIVSDWAAAWKSAEILIKQFDSTLRGPVAAEVLAALSASGRKKLLIAPAFPAAGRITRNGNVYVHGKLVHESSFASDPLNPVIESNIPALFVEHGISLQVATKPAQAIHLLDHHDAVLMDASDEQALLDIVAMAWARRDILWAGSTGLLRAFAFTLPERGARAAAFTASKFPAIVVGSQNPRSKQQQRNVTGHSASIFSTPDSLGQPVELTQTLVDQVVQAIQQGQCDGLIVTGGETAKQLARALQASGVSVLREVEPGIPLCILQTPRGDIPMITKAGGFGQDDVFLNCLQVIRGHDV